MPTTEEILNEIQSRCDAANGDFDDDRLRSEAHIRFHHHALIDMPNLVEALRHAMDNFYGDMREAMELEVGRILQGEKKDGGT